MTDLIPPPDVNNEWRLETPGVEGWTRTARSDADDKYFLCSADGHVQEPNDFLHRGIPESYHDRLPGLIIAKTEKKNQPEQFQKTEGFRAAKLNWVKPLEGHEKLRQTSGKSPEARVADLAIDGCDAEILFPNKGLTIWATPDAEFSHMMCRAYNDWAWEEFADFNDRLAPMACIAPAALDASIEEIQRCAALGFKGLALPVKPVFGPPDVDHLNYNLKEMEPLWECIVDVDLPVDVPHLDRS